MTDIILKKIKQHEVFIGNMTCLLIHASFQGFFFLGGGQASGCLVQVFPAHKYKKLKIDRYSQALCEDCLTSLILERNSSPTFLRTHIKLWSCDFRQI